MNFKITIIIPCYNAEKWVAESIQSALNQTYQNTEVIVVDNESTDGSYDIIKDLHAQNPIFQIGSAPNLYKYSWEEPVEKALSMATGHYFTIVGADDYLREDYIENIAKILKSSAGKIRVLQTPIMGVQGNKEKYLGEIKNTYRGLDEFKALLFDKCPVTTPSVVYDKKLHDEGIIRWNSKEYLGAVDYELYFNLAHHGIFIYPFPQWIGYYYRWHEGQATWGMHKETTNYDQLIKENWKTKWKQN